MGVIPAAVVLAVFGTVTVLLAMAKNGVLQHTLHFETVDGKEHSFFFEWVQKAGILFARQRLPPRKGSRNR